MLIIIKMRIYLFLTAAVALVDLAAATLLIMYICDEFENDERFTEAQKREYKFHYSSYAIISFASLISLIMPLFQRREFFSIFAPIFIGLPSTLMLIVYLTTFKEVPSSVIVFTMDVGVPLQYLLFALQYLRASLTVPIYFEHSE